MENYNSLSMEIIFLFLKEICQLFSLLILKLFRLQLNLDFVVPHDRTAGENKFILKVRS